MNLLKLSLVTAVLLIWGVQDARSQVDPIPVGPDLSFDYYPEQYVVVDKQTGIAWPAGEAFYFMGAGSYQWVAKKGADYFMTFEFAGGYTDWRLPTVEELFTAYEHRLIDAQRDAAILAGMPYPAYPKPGEPEDSYVNWAADSKSKNMAIRVDYVNGVAAWFSVQFYYAPYFFVRDTR